jgi:hypothetical protein
VSPQRQVVKVILVAAALGAIVALGAAAPGVRAVALAPSALAEQSKYYIVGEGQNGERETPFSIAAATLGNGNRYPELFTLNQDRIQPDGQRLTDPLVIKPGWVLELPADAKGAGVRIGPVPVYAPATAASDSAVTTSAATDADAALGGAIRKILSPTIGVLMVGLVVVLLILLRRGHRPAVPAPTRAAPVDPVAPALLTAPAPATAPVSVAAAIPVKTPVSTAASVPVAEAAPIPAAPVSVGTHGGVVPLSAGLSGLRMGPARFHTASASRARGPVDDLWTQEAEPPDRPASARPPERLLSDVHNGSARRSPIGDTEVRHGGDVLAVSLIGRRQRVGPPTHTWMRRREHIGPPAGVIPVAVGAGAQGTLVVDLACAPDVVTIVGPDEAPHRHARRLAEQLVAAGTQVSATVGTFDEPLPVGCQLLSDLDDPRLADAARPQVVFCPAGPARGRASDSRSPSRSIRRLISRRSTLVVIVLVGSPRRSRWCIDVRPATY